jgi:hypothetical protein
MFSKIFVGTLIKKKKKIFLINKEIQMGAVAKSYMRKNFLIYEEMRKYLVICEEAVSHNEEGLANI